MSDDEIVETIARFEGWTPADISRGEVIWWNNPSGELKTRCLDYLESRDALAPVLAELSGAQRRRFVKLVFIATGSPDPQVHEALVEDIWDAMTCSPRTLAQAVAEVLREGGGE